MKVAIIGGGVSGLSCAHELERYGVKPHIYEKNDFIGEAYPHVSAFLDLISRPIKDPIKYFNKKFNIKIKPLNEINTLTHFSPNKKTIINGNFGYLMKRGKEKDSLKNQIFSQLKKSKIIFNELADYEELSKAYDYVVVASGNANFTEELGCWYDWIVTYLKVGVVLGDFDPNTIVMWINKEYCKNGYAYLTPFSKKRASIVLVVTDVTEKQVDLYWDLFKDTENLDYDIIQEYKLKNKTGYVWPHNTNNIYFIGNAGGGTDPFLGFGQLNAVITGVKAARSIVKGKKYEKSIKDLIKYNTNMYQFRKAFNKATNSDYDKIITAIGLPLVKQSIYKSKFNVVKIGGNILKIKNKMDESKLRK